MAIRVLVVLVTLAAAATAAQASGGACATSTTGLDDWGTSVTSGHDDDVGQYLSGGSTGTAETADDDGGEVSFPATTGTTGHYEGHEHGIGGAGEIAEHARWRTSTGGGHTETEAGEAGETEHQGSGSALETEDDDAVSSALGSTGSTGTTGTTDWSGTPLSFNDMTPEPATLVLLAMGGAAILGARARRKTQRG